MASSNREDEVDIYGDLPDFNLEESIQKLEAENKALSERVEDLSSRVTELEMENKDLIRANRNLKANISALLKTVQVEIQRKDNTITELRQEREDLFFRRHKPNPQTRSQASAEKQDTYPSVAENRRKGKDESSTKRTTCKNNSSGEKRTDDAVTSKKTIDEPSRVARTKTADDDLVASVKPSVSEREAGGSSTSPVETQTPTLSSLGQENSERLKIPAVYRLIPISNNSPTKVRNRTLSRTSDKSTKHGAGVTQVESKVQSVNSKKGCNGEGATLSTPQNVPPNSASPQKSGRKTLSEVTRSESANPPISQADSTSPKKRSRKPPTARLYVKTRSSARLSAKLQNSALDTSNDGKDVSVLEALQLEERNRHDFTSPVREALSPPIPEILSPFPDSDQSPSPSRSLRQGSSLSGVTPPISTTPVSNINSLIFGILKSPTACHASAFHQYESGMPKDSAELQTCSDKAQKDSSRRTTSSSRESNPLQEDTSRKGVSSEKDISRKIQAVSGKVNTVCAESSTRKEEKMSKDTTLQNKNGPGREVKKRDEATFQREEKKHDKEKRREEEPRKEEIKSVEEIARRKEILPKKGSKRKEETLSQNGVQTKEETIREEMISRKVHHLYEDSTAGNEEHLRKERMTRNEENPRKEERARKEGTDERHLRKEGTSRNEEHFRKEETPRNEEYGKKEGTAHNGEPFRKEVVTRHEDRLRKEVSTCNGEPFRTERTRDEEHVRNERSLQNGEPLRKEVTACNGELRMEGCSRKEEQLRKDKLRTDEIPKNVEAPSQPFYTNAKPSSPENTREVQEDVPEKRYSGISNGRPSLKSDCPPLKIVQSETNSQSLGATRPEQNVSKVNLNSDTLQCNFQKRRRTRIELKVMVKPPANTPNKNGGEVISKVIFQSPPSSKGHTGSLDVNKTNHKEESVVQETRTQTSNLNKVVEKSVRDVPQTSTVVSREKDPSPSSSNYKKVHNDIAQITKHSNYPNKRFSNDFRRRSRSPSWSRSRSRSRPRYNSRENLPPVQSNHSHRHPKAFRSPHRYRQSRRDDLKGHGFNFSRRSRSLSPRFALNRQNQRKEEMSRLSKLPSDKKKREMLLFGKSPDRNSPMKREPPQRPIIVTMNVRRKRKVNLEDDETKTRAPKPPSASAELTAPARLSSSKQLVQTPFDFRERYAEVFSNTGTGESSDSESGAFSSESESDQSRKSDDSYRPKKKRKKPPQHKSTREVKKAHKDDKEYL